MVNGRLGQIEMHWMVSERAQRRIVTVSLRDGFAFNITETHLARLSPYRYTHINKYGDYILDLQRPVEPMHTRIKFSFKERAARAAA